MKRKLTISLVNLIYYIKSDDGKSVSMSAENLVLQAKDLYEQFFFDVTIGQPIEIDVQFDESATVGAAEKKVCEKIKEIIDLIVNEINSGATLPSTGSLEESQATRKHQPNDSNSSAEEALPSNQLDDDIPSVTDDLPF